MFAQSDWLRAHRASIIVGAGAFVIRAIQNLFIHPPLSDAHSDMGGYIRRADILLRGDYRPDPGATFFPYGTHILLFVLKWIFGSYASIGVSLVFAAISTFAVVFSIKTAQRLWPDRTWAHWTIGVLLAIEPAWIELASYALSETPTALAISASTYFSLKLADEGKTRDAWWLGTVIAIGSTFRPQVLMTLPFLFLVAIWRRGSLARVGLRAGIAIAIPVAVVLAISAEHTHYDTGQWGTISTNGPFNMVFGRCHCEALSAAQSPGNRFEPPSLRALYLYKERHGMTPIFDLDPAIAPQLSFDGKSWESAPAYALARQCVEKTGPLRQIKYGLTHWILLWAYNLPWPTDNIGASIGMVVGAILQLPGLLVALALMFRKSRARELTLLAHFFGLLTTAAIFFGEARLRTPYDGVILILAFGIYADAFAWYRRAKSQETEVGGGAPQLD